MVHARRLGWEEGFCVGAGKEGSGIG